MVIGEKQQLVPLWTSVWSDLPTANPMQFVVTLHPLPCMHLKPHTHPPTLMPFSRDRTLFLLLLPMFVRTLVNP